MLKNSRELLTVEMERRLLRTRYLEAAWVTCSAGSSSW
jgi:hypothetical protein